MQTVGHRGADCGTICALVIEDVINHLQDSGVKLVRFLYCDYGGIIRTKVVHHSSASCTRA
jgi:glutamine synthetase